MLLGNETHTHTPNLRYKLKIARESGSNKWASVNFSGTRQNGGGGGVRKVRETLERAGRKDKPTTLFIIHLQAGENAAKLHNL